tara:strand:+ start:12 stop:722 length:711 start_codon:yes stop_codon:yes gene_type:complete
MDDGLTIDWTVMPTYNTIMAVAAGAGLLSLVVLGWRISRGQAFSAEGHAVNFGVLGAILTITGAHMTLTWPFAAYFPFDNIIFGEPSLALGVLLLAAAVVLWRRRAVLSEAERPGAALAAVAAPLSILIVGLGLSMIAIAAAGIAFQLFTAPPEEPLTGFFAQWPWLETIFISGLYAITGVGALTFPLAAQDTGRGRSGTAWQYTTGVTLGLSGLAFLLFGALNFFTHIGLIVNTM